jgi:hypothetical protein
MSFLSKLFGKKKSVEASAPAPAPQMPAPAPARADPTAALAAAAARAAVPKPRKEPSEDTAATSEILQNLAERLKEPAATGIWDIEEDAPAAAPAAEPGPVRSSRRNKTRLIGFDSSENSVVDLFGDDAEVADDGLAAAPAATAAPAQHFPVGWAVVIQGPGRGHAFPLGAGMSSVGRGEDQAVRLDFGDVSISREGHAHIVYDPEVRAFMIGQGGKSNIVRLNGRPVIATETMQDGAQVKIGETILMLKTLCGPEFDWADTEEDEGDDDVAIA